MDLNDPFPFPPEAIRRRGPPPLEPLARPALPLRTTRRRDVLTTEDESDDYSSDGSFDTLRDAMHSEGARETARTTDVIPRPPWRSAPLASRTAPATAQDVLALEQEAQTSWSSLGTMRSLKDRLYGENKVLRAELDALKKELDLGRKREAKQKTERDRVTARYEDAWRERVLLAEQLSVSSVLCLSDRSLPDTDSVKGPASMPLDILLTIAGFLAGSNEYGSLLNFSLVSKVIHQEFKPVLYETMWFAERKRYTFDGTEPHSDVFKFVK
jgi:regulator of replication initiation timing